MNALPKSYKCRKEMGTAVNLERGQLYPETMFGGIIVDLRINETRQTGG